MTNTKLVNKTYLDDNYLRELIAFAKPAGVRNAYIEITYTVHWWSIHGRAKVFPGQWLVRDDKWYDGRIKILIPRKHSRDLLKFPLKLNYGPKYFNHEDLFLSFTEKLLSTLAHEWYHLKQNTAQRRGKRIVRGFNSRGSLSEKDTTRYATKTVRRWRRMHAPKDAIETLTWLLGIEPEKRKVELVVRSSPSSLQCKLCGRRLSSRLKAHIKRVHPRVKVQRFSSRTLERYFK